MALIIGGHYTDLELGVREWPLTLGAIINLGYIKSKGEIANSDDPAYIIDAMAAGAANRRSLS